MGKIERADIGEQRGSCLIYVSMLAPHVALLKHSVEPSAL